MDQPSSLLRLQANQRRIVGLNNHGVRMLQQNNSRQALVSLLHSLDLLKQTSCASSATASVCHALKEQEDTTVEPPSLFCREPVRSSSSTSTSAADASTSDQLGRDMHVTTTHGLPFQMFDQVFTFGSTTCSTSTSASTACSCVGRVEHRDGSMAAIMYNMAMTHHSRALDLLEGLRSPRVSLLKAVQLYTHALHAIQQWARHYVVHQGCHLLRLAILNNLAHANALLAQHHQEQQQPSDNKLQEAQHCLQCLRDILTYAKGHVTQQEYSFFAANVVVLCLKGSNGSLVVAPAAAA